MPIPPEFESFWASAMAAGAQLESARFLEAFVFGDSAGLAAELGQLVVAEVKRATASLIWTYEVENRPPPKPGDLSIVTDWEKRPLCIIETTKVDVVPFEEVTAEFAQAEGEGDATLSSWRRNHEAFFARECARIGRTPSARMPVVCERFHVIYQPGAKSAAQSVG